MHSDLETLQEVMGFLDTIKDLPDAEKVGLVEMAKGDLHHMMDPRVMVVMDRLLAPPKVPDVEPAVVLEPEEAPPSNVLNATPPAFHKNEKNPTRGRKA